MRIPQELSSCSLEDGRITTSMICRAKATAWILARCGSILLSDARADEPQQLTLAAGAEAELLDVTVTDEPKLAEGIDIAVSYWGDSGAIALLQSIAWDFDVERPDCRRLPLGIAPLSELTSPPATVAAITIRTTGEGSVMLLADSNGLVGVRAAQGIDAVGPPVHEFHYVGDIGPIMSGCTATVGDCSCSANQAGSCRKWHEGGTGRDMARCQDNEGVTVCWAKGGACGCDNVPTPTP